MSETPPDPMTALMEGATQLHELFLTLKAAGFTEEQAFTLVRDTLRKPTA